MDSKLLRSLQNRKHGLRMNSVRKIASRPQLYVGVISILIESVEKLPERLAAEKKVVHWGDRLDEEQVLFEALCHYMDDPTLPRELPRIAERLLAVIADPDADGDEFQASRYAANLIRRFGVPKKLISSVAKILESDRIGKHQSECLIEAIAKTGGPEAVRVLEAELARARRGVPWSTIEQVEAAIKKATNPENPLKLV